MFVCVVTNLALLSLAMVMVLWSLSTATYRPLALVDALMHGSRNRGTRTAVRVRIAPVLVVFAK
jgi:hypothetical protein